MATGEVICRAFCRGSIISRWHLSAPGRLLLSTYLDREHERIGGSLELRADAGVVIAME